MAFTSLLSWSNFLTREAEGNKSIFKSNLRLIKFIFLRMLSTFRRECLSPNTVPLQQDQEFNSSQSYIGLKKLCTNFNIWLGLNPSAYKVWILTVLGIWSLRNPDVARVHRNCSYVTNSADVYVVVFPDLCKYRICSRNLRPRVFCAP
jgi:hypothetical protein